jgi:LysR family cys regulon transcriptional activator
MKIQQLRYVREAVRRDFNLTAVAQALHTSQPGVSRQIRELEEELGIEVFVRAGKRLTGLTGPGQTIVPMIERLLLEAENLRRAGDEFAAQGQGILTIAATHSQARYALPTAVRDFSAVHPQVVLRMHQGSPPQIAQMLISGDADLGIATEALASHPELVTMPCYRWTHSVIVRTDHPLSAAADQGILLTLDELVRYPIMTYETGYTGRRHIDEAFDARQLKANIVLEAMDADVIKTYVELGMGVGIVAGIAYDAERDLKLRAIDARHLFGINLTRLAIRRGNFLRAYVYDFIETFAPSLTRNVVDEALT